MYVMTYVGGDLCPYLKQNFIVMMTLFTLYTILYIALFDNKEIGFHMIFFYNPFDITLLKI